MKSGATFDEVPGKINQKARYVAEGRELTARVEAIRVCFRRSGVISGYVVHHRSAHAVATGKFDGALCYQMFLTELQQEFAS